MTVQDLTQTSSVLEAIAEFDRIGRSAFLYLYEFSASTKFFLVHERNCYDTKAIVGAAYAYQFPEREPLRASDFSGGLSAGQAAGVLQRLGFRVVEKLDALSVRTRIAAEAQSSGGKLGGGRTVHKAVLLRYLVAQLGPDSERLTSTVDLAAAITDELAAAMPDLKTTNPHQPIWRLDDSVFSLVDDTGFDPRLTNPTNDPQTKLLNSGDCRGGLSPEVFTALRDDSKLIDEALNLIEEIIDGTAPNTGPIQVKKSGRQFGTIDGVSPGAWFKDRVELYEVGIHRHKEAGIVGGGKEGAESIVISGGYIDDQDFGDVIIYTGHGGRDSATKRQVADQELARQNLALAVSCDRGLPVRIIRGSKGDPEHSPSSGYRYDGLFTVTRYWEEPGRDGFKIQRFRLEKHPEAEPLPTPNAKAGPAQRTEVTTQRIVRNSSKGRKIKDLYDFTCQICDVRIQTVTGGYAEAAHIQPLGSPHDGPDIESNLLCLCANCHVRFDKHAICIEDDLSIWDRVSGHRLGRLHTHRDHQIDVQYLRYHRGLYRNQERTATP